MQVLSLISALVTVNAQPALFRAAVDGPVRKLTSSNKNGDDTDADIKTQINALQSKQDSHEATFNNYVTVTNGKFTNNDSRLAAIEKHNTEHKAEFSAHEKLHNEQHAEFVKHEEEFVKLSKRVEELEKENTAQKESLAALTIRVAALESA